MIKTFKYRKLEVKVKTNQVIAGVAHFNIGINELVEEAYKRAEYNNGHNCPEDIIVVEVFNALKAKGVAPFEVSLGNTAYRGVKLTDVSSQEKLVE